MLRFAMIFNYACIVYICSYDHTVTTGDSVKYIFTIISSFTFTEKKEFRKQLHTQNDKASNSTNVHLALGTVYSSQQGQQQNQDSRD